MSSILANFGSAGTRAVHNAPRSSRRATAQCGTDESGHVCVDGRQNWPLARNAAVTNMTIARQPLASNVEIQRRVYAYILLVVFAVIRPVFGVERENPMVHSDAVIGVLQSLIAEPKTSRTKIMTVLNTSFDSGEGRRFNGIPTAMFKWITYSKPPAKGEPTYPGGILSLVLKETLENDLTPSRAEKVFGKAVYISESDGRFTYKAPCGTLILKFKSVANKFSLEEVEIGYMHLLAEEEVRK